MQAGPGTDPSTAYLLPGRYSREGNGLSLTELIRASTDFALTGSGIRPQIHIEDDVPPVDADAGQINQVLHNLMINAVEAMPNGGTVTIRVSRVQMHKDKDRMPLATGEYVLISVLDHGIGIPNKHIARIFDPYFTTKKKGSGLGLATCYSIIKNHEGHIAVESELGRGSIFRVYLPASLVNASQGSRSRRTVSSGAEERCSSWTTRKPFAPWQSRCLPCLGYETLFAVGRRRRRSTATGRRVASGKRIDAVILDLTIPGGMGGKDVMEKLLVLEPAVKAHSLERLFRKPGNERLQAVRLLRRHQQTL